MYYLGLLCLTCFYLKGSDELVAEQGVGIVHLHGDLGTEKVCLALEVKGEEELTLPGAGRGVLVLGGVLLLVPDPHKANRITHATRAPFLLLFVEKRGGGRDRQEETGDKGGTTKRLSHHIYMPSLLSAAEQGRGHECYCVPSLEVSSFNDVHPILVGPLGAWRCLLHGLQEGRGGGGGEKRKGGRDQTHKSVFFSMFVCEEKLPTHTQSKSYLLVCSIFLLFLRIYIYTYIISLSLLETVERSVLF